MLFYKRIFREEQKCPENDLAEVTDKILDKCGGVPLAIIAIASLLVDRPWEDWSKTYDSINFGHEDNTMRILSYSYYDLPSYLKLCLLDLGMFPEDSTISKDRSIWRWIAQGFIHLDNEGGHLFQLGERYFNELLNRSMIQPVENSDHSICACRLHDIVLDLIQALSREENFMTKFSLVNCTHSEIGTKMKEMSQPSPSLHSKARRLSIEGCILQQIPQDTIGMPELLRTLSIQNSEIQNMHPLSIFKVCRVLMIESSKIPHLRDLGKLLHLKFLVIDKAPIDELPKEIGNLRSLQSLIISGTRIRELPLTVFSLTQLMYMRIEEIGNLPVDRIGNLTSLEELCLNPIFGESAAYDFARELGKLTRLRVLEINFYDAVDDSWHQVFLQSLCSLREIHNLDLQFVGETSTAGATWEGWELPRQLQLLYIACISFSWLPATINRSLVPGLRYLTASVETIGAQDIENLGRLPELQYLCLYLNGPTPILIPEFIVCSADGFKNLRACKVSMQFKFLQGAMPKLEILDFSVPVRFRRQTMNEISDFDFGLVNLISLERVSAWVSCFDASEMDVAKAEAALRRAVEDHPNRPTLQMIRTDEYDMLSDQDLKVQEAEPSFRISVREMKDNGTDPDIYSNLQSCLEKVNIDVDCENANLREVEEVEAALRQAANVDTKSPSPTLELTRINTDKMVSASDNCYSENDQDDSAGNNSITQLPSVQNEQDIWSDKKEMLDS
uniref:Uncharacterized protein n=1 Tax=Leersia perrieri TaxID=77586 RepID=A0A0D9WG10_9ORYZ